MPPRCLVIRFRRPASAAGVRRSPSPTQSGDAASACKRWDFCVRCGVHFVDRRYVAEFGDLDA